MSYFEKYLKTKPIYVPKNGLLAQIIQDIQQSLNISAEKWVQKMNSQNLNIIRHQELQVGYKGMCAALFTIQQQYMCIYDGQSTITVFDINKPYQLLQQIELPAGQQINVMCMIEDSPLLIFQLTSKNIVVYSKQSSYFKEVTILKEKIDQITCIQSLPTIKISEQYTSWAVFGTSNQDVYILNGSNKYPYIQKILSLSSIPVNIAMCVVPVTLIDEHEQSLSNNVDNQQQSVIICIQTSSSVTFFLCKQWQDRVQAVKIGKRLKVALQSKAMIINSTFYFDKKENQLYCFYQYDSLGTLIVFDNLHDNNYYKSVNTKVIFEQQMSLLTESTIMINLLSTHYLLIAYKEGYNLIDIRSYVNDQLADNNSDIFAQIDREIQKNKIIQKGSYGTCNSHNLATVQSKKVCFLLTHEHQDQSYKLQQLNIQSILEQINDLKQTHCFCSLDLLIQKCSQEQQSFVTYSDAFLTHEEKLQKVIDCPQMLNCIVSEAICTQCVDIITSQFLIESQLYQALNISIVDNILETQEVKMFIIFICKVLIRVAMGFDVMDNVIMSINKLQLDQIQQFMKDMLIKQVIGTLATKQLHMQPAILVDIMKHTKFNELQDKLEHFEVIKSYIVLNSMSYNTFQQTIVLIENEKLYWILPASFLLMIIGNQSFSTNQKNIVDSLFQIFVKYILINLKPDKKHEDEKMLQALSVVLQILLENDFQNFIKSNFITSLQINEIQLSNSLDQVQNSQVISQYGVFDLNTIRYEKFNNDTADKYFLPLYMHNQLMVSLYKSKNFEYCTSYSRYQELINAVYNIIVKNSMILQDKTSLIALHNTVAPLQQVKIYTLLIQNQYLNSKYTNFLIEVYQLVYNYLFNENNVLDKLIPQAGKFIWIIVQIIKHAFYQQITQLMNYIYQNQQQKTEQLNVQSIQYPKMQLNPIQEQLLQLISVKQLAFILEYISNYDEIDKFIILGTHKQVIEAFDNNKLISLQVETNNMIEIGDKYYILIILHKILSGKEQKEVQQVQINDYLFIFSYCILNQYLSINYIQTKIEQVVDKQCDVLLSTDIDILRLLLADLQGNAVQCVKYLINISPQYAIDYLIYKTISKQNIDGVQSLQLQYEARKKQQIVLSATFDQLYDQICQNDHCDSIYRLLTLLIICYKDNFGNCLQLLSKEKYEKLCFMIVCTILAPQYLQSQQDFFLLQKLFIGSDSNPKKSLERLFLSITDNNEIVNNICTYLPQILQILSQNLEKNKLFKVFDIFQSILADQRYNITITTFLEHGGDVIAGIYLLQISQQHEKQIELFQSTFKQIQQKYEEQLIEFVDKCIQVFSLNQRIENSISDLFSFLELTNSIKNLTIREQITKSFVNLFSNFVTSDALCDALCNFYAKQKWNNAKAIFEQIIEQTQLQRDLERQLNEIAKKDLQKYYASHYSQLRRGVVVEVLGSDIENQGDKYKFTLMGDQ